MSDKRRNLCNIYNKDDCQLIKDSLKLGKKIRNQFVKIIKYGYQPSSNPISNKLVEEIERLIAMLIRIQEAGYKYKCVTPIDINNAIDSSTNVLRNTQFIIDNQQLCASPEALFSRTLDIFTRFTLGTLSILNLECSNLYTCSNGKCDRGRYSYCDDVNDDYTKDTICEVLVAALSRGESSYRILRDTFKKFELNEKDPLTEEVINILAEDYRVIRNELQFILSQFCNLKTKCSSNIIVARIEQVRLSASLLDVSLRLYNSEAEDCVKLLLLGRYLLSAQVVVSFLYEVLDSIGCRDKQCNDKGNYRYVKSCNDYNGRDTI